MANDIHSGDIQLDCVIALSTRRTFMPAWQKQGGILFLFKEGDVVHDITW